MVREDPEDLQRIVAVGLDLVRRASYENLGHIFHLLGLFETEDRLDSRTELFGGVHTFRGVETIVTRSAIIGLILLTEIVEQRLAAADGGLRIGRGLDQKLARDLLFHRRFRLNEFLELLYIFIGVESDAVAFAAVTPGASGLLIISLKAFGNVVVDHEADVGLVDTHAESDSGHDYLDLLVKERILVDGTRISIHAGVVGQRLDIVYFQNFSKLLDLLSREAIDDAGFSRS